MEEAIAETEELMAGCGSDYVKLQEYTDKLNELNAEYERLIERWTYLDGIVNGN